MPLKKSKFSIIQDNMVEAIDVDDSAGRSVPINMNFSETGYLSKDTGFSLFGATETTAIHSIFNYKKKDGTSKLIRAKGTKIQLYNTTNSLWEDTTKTITAGAKFGYVVYDNVLYACNAVDSLFTYDGTTFTDYASAPKGNILEVFESRLFVSGVTAEPLSVYYSGFGNSSFVSGTCTISIATPGVVTKTNHGLTAGVGVTFTTTGALPTGIVAGTTYYVSATNLTVSSFELSATPGGVSINTSGSQSGVHTISSAGLSFTSFQSQDVFRPLGVDVVTGLENYYGYLLVFKKESIWKVTMVEVVTGLFAPKQELQSNNYGACSRTAISWVENDLWFFTGREVRAFGFKDQQTGVMGINTSVISEPIKDTLYTINPSYYSLVNVFYNNRKFYLSVPITSTTANDLMFVCHTLYKNSWTKFVSRDKAKTSEMIAIDNTIYSVKNVTPFVVLKWDESLLNDNGTAISSEVVFKRVEDKDFNLFNIYRYLDLMFKNLTGKITITIYSDKSDVRTAKTKNFYLGQGLEDELGALGETDFGESLVADSYGQTITSSPFIKRRISFLSKAQSINIGLSNAGLGETFTIAQFALMGMKQEKDTFAPDAIVSIK
jgi:hypothetical protein